MKNKITKNETKHLAKETMMRALTISTEYIDQECDGLSEEQKDEVRKEMEFQLERVEKLFGWEPGLYRFNS